MKRLIILLLLLAIPFKVDAVRSVIAEGEGSACAPKGPVTEKTEQQAMTAALKEAHRNAGAHVVRQGGVKDPAAQQELLALYLNSPERGIQPLKTEKYRNGAHRCERVKVRAEIVPDEKGEEVLQRLLGDGAGTPLAVRVWPERPVYREGETITFFVKGNKEFYGSIVYTDAADNIVQIIPSRFYPDPSFHGDKAYEFPGNAFVIRVSPPAFGTEKITVYAATVPLDLLAEIVPTGTVEGAYGAKAVGAPRAVDGVVEYVEVVGTLTTSPAQ